jgi:hypothetical protein
MADAKKEKGGDKKEEKKPAGSNLSLSWSLEGIGFIALMLCVAYIFIVAIFKLFGSANPFTPGVGTDGSTTNSFSTSWLSFREWFASFFSETVTTITFLSIFLTLMFIMGAFYAKFRREEIIALAKYNSAKKLAITGGKGGGKKITKHHGAIVGGTGLPGTGSAGLATVESAGSAQWKQIEKYMQSNNQADWRYAIMEADILLYDMLEQIGIPGETIGDKLKSANSASFTTLDYAWKAHKVRNLIAHQGMTYELSYNDARNTIIAFKKVFDEFYFI